MRGVSAACAVLALGCAESDGPAGIELAALSTIEGFSVSPVDVVEAGASLLGAFRVQAAPGAPIELQVLRFDNRGTVERLAAVPYDLTAGRISAVVGGTFARSRTLASDGVLARVAIGEVDLATSRTGGVRELPEPVVGIPPAAALHLADDQSLWVLATTGDFVTTLYVLGADGATRSVPLAGSVFVDGTSRLGASPHGVVAMLWVDSDDAAALGRLGIEPASHGGHQAVLASLDCDGAILDASVVPLDRHGVPAALWVKDREIVLAGQTTIPGSNEADLFVGRFRLDEAGRIERGAVRVFAVGEHQNVVHDVSVLAGGRVAVAGEVGLRQAPTASVIEGSRAFVAILQPDLSGEPRVAHLGDPVRRNAGVALAFDRERLLLLSLLDFPKTHDADTDPAQAYARAVLYEVLLDDVSGRPPR